MRKVPSHDWRIFFSTRRRWRPSHSGWLSTGGPSSLWALPLLCSWDYLLNVALCTRLLPIRGNLLPDGWARHFGSPSPLWGEWLVSDFFFRSVRMEHSSIFGRYFRGILKADQVQGQCPGPVPSTATERTGANTMHQNRAPLPRAFLDQVRTITRGPTEGDKTHLKWDKTKFDRRLGTEATRVGPICRT